MNLFFKQSRVLWVLLLIPLGIGCTEMEELTILPAPEGIGEELAKNYKETVAQTDNMRDFDLANVSNEVGVTLAQKGEDRGYDYLIQAGQLLRRATANGVEVPEQQLAIAYYNEACGLSRKGETEKGLKALAASAEAGFPDLALLQSDSDLESLRNAAGFDAIKATVEGNQREVSLAQAKSDLLKGESFPFAFTLTDLDGQERSLDDYAGQVVIVDVWGTWCPPCRAEIPSFVKLQDAFGKDGLQMLGINYEKGEEDTHLDKVKEFVAENGVNYPCMLGTDEVREQIPDFRGFPTTLFIDRSGKVRLKAVGLHDYAYLEGIVTSLLKEEPAS